VSPRTSRLVEAGILALVAVAFATLLVTLPQAVDRLQDRASRWSSFTLEDREFAAGNSVVPDKQLLYEARGVIPRDEAFRVALGGQPVENEQALTRVGMEVFARYFLAPRRLLRDDARWVVCVGCEVEKAAPGGEVVWTNGGGSSLIRLPG
jgi:hypothetical protein